jgi:hypothetical protein
MSRAERRAHRERVIANRRALRATFDANLPFPGDYTTPLEEREDNFSPLSEGRMNFGWNYRSRRGDRYAWGFRPLVSDRAAIDDQLVSFAL